MGIRVTGKHNTQIRAGATVIVGLRPMLLTQHVTSLRSLPGCLSLFPHGFNQSTCGRSQAFRGRDVIGAESSIAILERAFPVVDRLICRYTS